MRAIHLVRISIDASGKLHKGPTAKLDDSHFVAKTPSAANGSVATAA